MVTNVHQYGMMVQKSRRLKEKATKSEAMQCRLHIPYTILWTQALGRKIKNTGQLYCNSAANLTSFLDISLPLTQSPIQQEGSAKRYKIHDVPQRLGYE